MEETKNISTPIRRLGSAMLDSLISGALAIFVIIPVFPMYKMTGFYFPSRYMNAFAFSRMIFFIIAFSLGMLVIQIYFWSRSQSIGKAILGMKVVDSYTNEPIGLGKMIIREVIGKWISGLVMSLGYIWILIDKDSQGWHDKLVSSIVIDIEK